MKKKIEKIYKGPKYPTEAHGKIPSFSSYEEEANFWDTHDFTDFEDEFEEVEVVFDLEKPRDEVLTVRVQKTLKEKLNKVARRKGLNPSSLARMWIIEKLQSASA